MGKSLACEKKNAKLPESSPKLVFRAIGRNTDARTCIAAVLPEQSCFGNSCWGATMPSHDAVQLCGVLNSFALDFAIRLRISANMNFTHVGRVAVLPPGVATSLFVFETITAGGRDIEHITAVKDQWLSLWELNRSVAGAYSLTAEDFEYILSTFPVFARKHPEFYVYLLERVKEWKVDSRFNRPYAAAPREEPLKAAEGAEHFGNRAGSAQDKSGRRGS